MAGESTLPNVPITTPMVQPNGLAHPMWGNFFRRLFSRAGSNIAPTNAELETLTTPVGIVVEWYTNTLPDSTWIWANGEAISRSTYSELFSLWGTTFGSGDGSTTFNVIDKRGRVGVGQDDMGGASAALRVTTAGSGVDGATLGAVGGAQNVTLTTTEMPSHTHTQDAHTHTQNSHNHTQDPHFHATNYGAVSATSTGGAVMGSNVGGGIHTPNTTATNQAATATNQNTTATNQNTGGGGAHNNMPPAIVCNFIIKASAA